jgi:hypothetical protein
MLIATGSAATASSACFEVNDAKWAKMRSMVDEFVKDGTLDKATAKAYKCDPRLAADSFRKVVKITVEPASLFQVLASGYRFESTITVELGIPVGATERQGLYWCWDTATRKVSNWDGHCNGWVTGWGKSQRLVLARMFDQRLHPIYAERQHLGGVNHYSTHLFNNIVPWVPALDQSISRWGHYDGTSDYAGY